MRIYLKGFGRSVPPRTTLRRFAPFLILAAGLSLMLAATPSPAASGPMPQLSTTVLEFGNTQIGTTGGPLSITVSNAGTGQLTIPAVTLTGPNAGEFALTADGCTGQSLSQGQSCSVWLTLTPTAVGQRSATLSFVDNASGSPQTVFLTGTGVVAGYWLVAADGGIFTQGAAGFYGSAGGMRLNHPIVGMAGTLDGGGYWLAASDGGIFSYGDAQFQGSVGGMHLNQPIVGIAGTPDGGG